MVRDYKNNMAGVPWRRGTRTKSVWWIPLRLINMFHLRLFGHTTDHNVWKVRNCWNAMGKKRHASLALFVPKISEKSKQIALEKLKRLDTNGVPHFMIETKSTLYARQTLAPINRVNATIQEKDTWADSKKVVPNIGEKGFKNAETDMNRNACSPSSVTELDETIFTFRPKVSTASVRIAESLGTDFMSRQQQHLEKQRKLVSILDWLNKTKKL